MSRVIHLSIEVPEREFSNITFNLMVQSLRDNRNSGQGLSVLLPEGPVFDGILTRVVVTGKKEVTQ